MGAEVPPDCRSLAPKSFFFFLFFFFQFLLPFVLLASSVHYSPFFAERLRCYTAGGRAGGRGARAVLAGKKVMMVETTVKEMTKNVGRLDAVSRLGAAFSPPSVPC